MGWYRSGTVSVNNGSPTVTGSGTAFLSSKAKPGDLWRGPDFSSYEILSVNSNTSITLAENYRGSSVSGAAYAIVPTISPMRDLVDPVQTLVSDYSTVKADAGAGRFSGGSEAAPGISSKTDADTGLAWLAANALALIAAGAEVARASGAGLTAARLGVRSDAPLADLQVGNGASELLGSTAPLAWVSARANSTSGAPTTPQELLRLSWQEGSQDLGAGEGVALVFAASLAGDASTFYEVGRLASRKINSTDTDRSSSLVLQVSADGSAAPADVVELLPDGNMRAVNGIKFGAGSVAMSDYDEGTFTPEIADAATGGNVGSAATIQGSYTKSGRLVTVTVLILDIVTTGMTAGNDLYIRGLPFPARSLPNTQYTIGHCRLGRVTFAGTPCVMVSDNGSHMRIGLSSSAAAGTMLTVGAFESGAADVWATVTYETA